MEALPCPTESEILANLKLLVGTRISHRFEDENSDLTWYEGLVVEKIPDSELFEVIYFGEEEVYEFELLEDSTTVTLSSYTSRTSNIPELELPKMVLVELLFWQAIYYVFFILNCIHVCMLSLL